MNDLAVTIEISTLQSEQQWHGFKQTDRDAHKQTNRGRQM